VTFRSSEWLTRAFILPAVGLIVGSVVTASRPAPTPAQPADGLAWPPPPAAARIRYVASIEGPADVGAGPSLLGRVFGVLAGRGRQPRLLRPNGLATDARGRLIVADTEQRIVHVFDPARRRYMPLEGVTFGSPVGVAVGPDDTVYVTDSALRRVFAFTPAGRLRATLGLVRGEPALVRPTGIAVGRDGLIRVVDTVAASIVTLAPDGRILRTIGRRGHDAGEFNYPAHLAIDRAGLLHVVDSLNARVQVVRDDGTFVREFGHRGNGTGDFDKPKGVAVDADGHVYVAEALHDVFQVFDEAGRLLLVVGGSGSAPGRFALPSGLHIDGRGRVYVADALNGRVQVFQYVGTGNGN
jgi:DNA-binding beta-propeller fold protein YncE